MPTSLPSLNFNDSLTLMYDWVGGLIGREGDSAGGKNQALLKVPVYHTGSVPSLEPDLPLLFTQWNIKLPVFPWISHPVIRWRWLGRWQLVGFEWLQRPSIRANLTGVYTCAIPLFFHRLENLQMSIRDSVALSYSTILFVYTWPSCTRLEAPWRQGLYLIFKSSLSSSGNVCRMHGWKKEGRNDRFAQMPLIGRVPWIYVSKMSRNRVLRVSESWPQC